MFKKYSEYKHTPALWIDEIPVSWQSRKVSELFNERRTKVSDTDYQPLSVCKAGIVPQLETAVKTNNGDNRKLVKTGDFVINSRSDRKGSSGISPLDGSVSLINIVLELHTNDSRAFLHLLLRSYPFVEEYYRNGRGLVADLWTTRYSELRSIFLPIPPRPEQDQIVRYLDWQNAKINKFVKAKRKEIRRLQELKKAMICSATMHGITPNVQMKDCSYPWIGQIPAAWTETRAKNVLVKLNHPVMPDNELLICSNKGKVFFRGDAKIGLVSDSEDIYQGVRKGDLLIHGMDTWHGAIAVSDFDGKCTPVVHVCDSTQNKRFIAYYLQALAFKKVYKAISNGVRENTSDFRSWSKAGNILLILPPIKEQDEIAAYLDDKCFGIEQLIVKIKAEIDLVEEYRTRLISDVVTGKVDVRDIEIPDLEIATSDDTEIDEVSDDEDIDEDTQLEENEEMGANEDDDN